MDPVKNVDGEVQVVTDDDMSKRRKSNASDNSEPPDGGLHAWIIVVASFLINGIVFGIHNCYGIIYVHLKMQLEQSGVSDAALKACKSNFIIAFTL